MDDKAKKVWKYGLLYSGIFVLIVGLVMGLVILLQRVF